MIYTLRKNLNQAREYRTPTQIISDKYEAEINSKKSKYESERSAIKEKYDIKRAEILQKKDEYTQFKFYDYEIDVIKFKLRAEDLKEHYDLGISRMDEKYDLQSIVTNKSSDHNGLASYSEKAELIMGLAFVLGSSIAFSRIPSQFRPNMFLLNYFTAILPKKIFYKTISYRTGIDLKLYLGDGSDTDIYIVELLKPVFNKILSGIYKANEVLKPVDDILYKMLYDVGQELNKAIYNTDTQTPTITEHNHAQMTNATEQETIDIVGQDNTTDGDII